MDNGPCAYKLYYMKMKSKPLETYYWQHLIASEA